MDAWTVWTFVIWITIFVAIDIMRKLSPNTWVLYSIKSVIIGVVFTIFAVIHIV